MTASFASKASVRLFIQAAFTGLLAVRAQGSAWMLVTLAVAAGAAVVGVAVRSNPAGTRGIVVGFEVLAVAVGVVGLRSHHYIPGTIFGIVTLVTVLGSAGRAAPASPAPASGPSPACPPYAGGLVPPAGNAYAPPAAFSPAPPATPAAAPVAPPQPPVTPPPQRVAPPATGDLPPLPRSRHLPDA